MRVLSEHRNIRRQEISAPVARWTNVPSAPVALRIPNTSMVKIGCPKVSYPCVLKCARPRLCSPATATKLPIFIGSALLHVDLAPVPGVGEPRIALTTPDPCARAGHSLRSLFCLLLLRVETKSKAAPSNMIRVCIRAHQCQSLIRKQEKTCAPGLIIRTFKSEKGVTLETGTPLLVQHRAPVAAKGDDPK